ncbi:ABC transporter substrate-binding protein [uncultured Mucilaginibacter sp.]|uniref:ABC transporter substrate-binding protein n=1 Tax=uncultured Mucilaginibacter sp. TaxID=797541 RepID=UPI0025FF4EE4|nr:ABC transporter substrate-binding protein [uncultured Mucilaginibacter sp.]
MTSAQNHPLPLSGNKFKLWLLALILISACSPKVQPVGRTRPSQPSTSTVPAKDKKTPASTDKTAVKPQAAKVSSFALLLPFSLDNLNSVKGYSAAQLKSANIAVDYYQGFRLALDSLTAQGYNYKLQVFDTKDDAGATHGLSLNPAVNSSNLIVGPVFPQGIKTFIGKPQKLKRPLLSPLAPAAPEEFADGNLITVNPPLEYHAVAAARFVKSRIKPVKIFILSSGYSDDKKFASPFKMAIDTLSKRKIQVVYTTISKGNLTPLKPHLNNKVENVFIVPSVNQQFLSVTLRSLDTLSRKYPVTVIGHPSWEKLSFLKADILQRIKAHITSAERLNYRAAATVHFIRAYRKAYNSEPSSYAYKGFDQAMYFGTVMAQEGNELDHLDKHRYKALHNEFNFIKRPGLGWINTHVGIYKYANFELKQVE